MHKSITEANRLIKKHKTNDPFALCDYLNINVTITTLPNHINGFYTEIMEMPFIFLNETLNECELNATCAHELGHSILHPKFNSIFIEQNTLISSSKLENEADIFAAFLLIPSHSISDGTDDFVLTEQQLAYEFNVPIKYIKIKFSDTGS